MLKGTHCMSVQEQTELIYKLLKDNRVISHGGGRLVFEHPDYRDRVIKIAMGEGGIKQNELEADVYCDYSNNYDIFAHIFGYSSLIIEMEKVEPLPDLEYIEDEEEESVAWDIKYTLDDLIGSTADNEQLGKNECGDIVAYDYGFNPEEDCWNQTSELRDYDFCVERYLSNLIRILDEEITMEQLEFDTLEKCGKTFDDDDYEEEDDEDDIEEVEDSE